MPPSSTAAPGTMGDLMPIPHRMCSPSPPSPLPAAPSVRWAPPSQDSVGYGRAQSADYCSMLETSLHSPRHSRIIRNTYVPLTRTPQGSCCFSKAPNAAGALV